MSFGVKLLKNNHKLLDIGVFLTACDGTAGIEFAWVRDSLITASSEQEYAPAYRARLNAITSDAVVEGLSEGYSGGWKPALSDTDPWIQVIFIHTVYDIICTFIIICILK